MDPALITDASCNPVLDEVDLPDNREDYMMLPFGGTRENGSHKGYGYAAVAEVFCDILSGMGAGLSRLLILTALLMQVSLKKIWMIFLEV